MEYFGTTETFDPAFNFTWVDNLKVGNIIITKQLTDRLIQELLKEEVKSKCILHITCTGLAGSILEPNVPNELFTFIKLQNLIKDGFPVEQIVLRLSPIIPTEKGIKKALYICELFKPLGIKRIRFSTLNMYNHVKERFNKEGVPFPYNQYSCTQEMRSKLINSFLNHFNIQTNETWNNDCCGEIDLNKGLIEKIACVSQKDVDILGIQDKITLVGFGKQRSACMCPDNKKQIIRCKPDRCPHKCLYCYWKD